MPSIGIVPNRRHSWRRLAQRTKSEGSRIAGTFTTQVRRGALNRVHVVERETKRILIRLEEIVIIQKQGAHEIAVLSTRDFMEQ